MSPPELWMYCANETKLIDEHMYHTLYLMSINIDRHAGSSNTTVSIWQGQIRSGVKYMGCMCPIEAGFAWSYKL